MCALPDGSVLVNYANSFYINGQNPGALAHITASGNLDTSFSVSEFSFAFALYVYPNGSLLIQGMFAGDSSGNYYICRLLPNGSLDPTFTSFELNAGSSEIMARVQADGRILVWGKVVSLNLPQELALMRLNSDGSLDPTFTPIAAQSSMVQDVEQQADGKLLVAGQISFPPNTSYYMFLRLNTDGSVDSSFSTSFVGPDSSSNVGQWLAPLANGEILACGGMGIARLTSSGTVDTGYTAALPSSYQSISQLGLVNGVVYFVELASSSNQELYRLNADGTLDTSFVITAPYAVTYSVGIPVTWGGTTLYFGTALTSTRWQSRFTLSQTSSGGVLNAGFSPRFSKPAVPYTARQSDGKYLVAGSFDYVNGVNLGASPLARLNNDGTLDTTFNTAIDATTASSIRSMIEQPDGHIVAVVYAESTYLMRFNSDGSSDTTFPSTQCYAAKSDSSGNLYIEVKDPAGSGNILERLSPTGVLDPTFSTADMNIQQIIGATSDGMVVLAVLNPFTALIRLTNSGAVDPAFTVSYSAPGDQTFCVLPDNSVLAAVSTQPRNYDYGAPIAFTRYDTSGKQIYSYTGAWSVLTEAGVLFDQLLATAPASGEIVLNLPTLGNLDVRWDGQATVEQASSGASLSRYLRTSLTSPSESNTPAIIAQPVGATVPQGGPWALTVSAYGYAPFTYQWSKDGAPIAGVTGSLLLLNNLQLSDSGNYEVSVSNTYGSTSSNSAILMCRTALRPGDFILIKPGPAESRA